MSDFYVLPPKGYAAYTEGGPAGDTLQNEAVDQWPDGMTVWVKSQSALYALDKNSSATIASPYVIQAYPRGRWILGGGSSTVNVSTYAATLPGEPVLQFLGTRAYNTPGVNVVDTGYIDARAYLDQFGITDPANQDCTSALQSALNDAVSGSKLLVLPAGVLSISGFLSAGQGTTNALVRIEGSGPFTTSIRSSVAGTDNRAVFKVYGNGTCLMLSNLRFDANSNRQSAILVYGTCDSSSVFRNVSLRAASLYGNLSLAPDASLAGAKFYDFRPDSGAYSIYADDSTSLMDCDFMGARITGSTVGGIWLRNRSVANPAPVPSINIYGVDIENHYYSAVDALGGHMLNIWGSHVEYNANHDVTNKVPEIRVGGSILSGPTVAMPSTGTAPPVVKIVGNRSVFETFDTMELQVITPGALGTMVFQWRTKTGGVPGAWNTVSTVIGVTTYSAINTGYSFSLSAGSYSADNNYLFSQPKIVIDSGVAGNIDPLATGIGVEVQITVSGGFGVGKFKYRVYNGGVAGGWSADTTIQSSVTFPIDGGGSTYLLVGTFENRTYQYTPGDLTQCTYQYYRIDTRMTFQYAGVRLGALGGTQTNPRVGAVSCYTTLLFSDGTLLNAGDNVTGVSGTGTGSAIYVTSPMVQPMVSWPGMEMFNINPRVTGTAIIADNSTSSTVTLSYDQPSAGYYVMVTPLSVTGTPSAGSMTPYISARGTHTFTISVPTAPGAGNSVTYTWMMTRPHPLQPPP
jgi:hypothetical protein